MTGNLSVLMYVVTYTVHLLEVPRDNKSGTLWQDFALNQLKHCLCNCDSTQAKRFSRLSVVAATRCQPKYHSSKQPTQMNSLPLHNNASPCQPRSKTCHANLHRSSAGLMFATAELWHHWTILSKHTEALAAPYCEAIPGNAYNAELGTLIAT